MSYFLGDKSFLAIKPQAAPDTVVIPTIHLPIVSESIAVEPSIEADRRMKGLNWKSDDVLKGAKAVSGDVVFLGDVNTLAHLFNMLHLKGSTTGDATDGYTHPFTPGDGDNYTFEINRGDYAERFWGMRADKLTLNFVDNKLQATLAVKGLGHFAGGTLAAALTGAGMTSLVLNQEGDIQPTKGLVAGDILIVGGVEVEIGTVETDGITISFSSTAITASIGDPVYLKAQTPSLTIPLEPLTLNNTLVGFGADSSAADTAAASASTATECQDIEIEFSNNTIEAMQSGVTGTGRVLNGVLECQVRLKQLFETPDQHRKWIETTKQAITIAMRGKFIKSDFSTWELLTLKFHKVKIMSNGNQVAAGSYIWDDQEFEALYDASDAESVETEIVNTIAGTTL